MKKKQKILILPAIKDHVGVIKLARSMNFEVITCDNVPSNIGHSYANKSYNINILDYDLLIDMAKKEEIDFAWGYTTDIGALAASKVSDALGLGGNAFDVVNVMTDKTLFRNFLKKNAFNCPGFVQGDCLENISVEALNFPVVVKPVDRASSKGISVINTLLEWSDAFHYAQQASLSGTVIVEEYVEAKACQIEAEILVKNGEIVVYAVGDQFFSKINKQATVGTILPSAHKVEDLEKLKHVIARFITLIGYENGGINAESRIDSEGNVYLIELAPRSGGNYIPEALSTYYQMDIKEYLLSLITGRSFSPRLLDVQSNVFRYEWRATGIGCILGKHISPELNIVEEYEMKKIGDLVYDKPCADNIIAIFIIKGESREEIEDVYFNPEKYFSLELDNDFV